MAEGPPGEATSTRATRPVARQPRRVRLPAVVRDRRVLALSAVLVVLLVVIASVWWSRRDSRSERLREDAGFGTLTDEQAEATRAYLVGDGAPLLDLAGFSDRVASLAEEDNADDPEAADNCGGLAGEWNELSTRGGDQGMIGLRALLPDPTLGRLWASQLPTITDIVVLCEAGLGGAAVREPAQRIADMQEAVTLRLDDVGVGR